MVILLAAMLALPGKPGHALLELEKDVDRAEAILASGHGSLERAARLEISTDEMAADVMSMAEGLVCVVRCVKFTSIRLTPHTHTRSLYVSLVHPHSRPPLSRLRMNKNILMKSR